MEQVGNIPKKTDGSLTWIDMQTADKISNSEGKMYMIDIYTDWCGWCKVMDKQTFSDPEVVKYLDQNFHVVKFDAEQKEKLNFQGKDYEWMPVGRNGVHALAVELLNSQMSYPSIVYLDANKKPIRVSKGFKQPADFLAEVRQIKG